MRLTTVGRKTGKERSAILGYYEDGPNLVTMAMNGWAEPEPAWWLNLQAQPDVTVELKDGTRAVRGRRPWARSASACGRGGASSATPPTATRPDARPRRRSSSWSRGPTEPPPPTASAQRLASLSLAGLPDRDRQLAVPELDRRGTGKVGDVERIELLSPKVEPGLREQVLGKPRVQLQILDVPGLAPDLRVTVGEVRIDRGRVQGEPRVASQVAELRRVRHADERPGDPRGSAAPSG